MFKILPAAASVLAAMTSLQMASAQVTNDASQVPTGIATVLLNFEGAKIIPDVLPASAFNLSALLMQTFGSTSNTVGQDISIAMAASQPTWSLQYGDNTANSLLGDRYTIMTVDPGVATAEAPSRIVRHFLANNITITNGQLQNSTQPIAGWFSPAPPPGSGAHRYTTLVFEQPASFELPDSLSHRNTSIDLNFDVQDYISQTGLGKVIAATYFLAENTTTASTTVQPASTSSVASSAIQSAASSVSSSLVAAYGTPTATSASSGAPSGALASVSLTPQLALVSALAASIFLGAAVLL